MDPQKRLGANARAKNISAIFIVMNRSTRNPMMFFAGALCCCLVCVAVSCFFSIGGYSQVKQAFDDLKTIATGVVGSPYESAITKLKRHYASSGLNGGDEPQAVLVYRIGTSTVSVPNRKDILIGLGVDDGNFVRQMKWNEDWPGTIQAKDIVKTEYM